MPTTTVSETTYTDNDGNEQTQYRTTVPKGLAEAFDLGGAKISWEVETGSKLVVEKTDD
jgi:hypothetical protein